MSNVFRILCDSAYPGVLEETIKRVSVCVPVKLLKLVHFLSYSKNKGWHFFEQCKSLFTTTVLRPLYRTTCVSRNLQLRTGGFCWSKVLMPTRPCCQQLLQSVKNQCSVDCIVYQRWERMCCTLDSSLKIAGCPYTQLFFIFHIHHHSLCWVPKHLSLKVFGLAKDTLNRSHSLPEITEIKSWKQHWVKVKTSGQADSPACTMAACTAIAPSRVAGIGDSEPWNEPSGVRTALAITTSCTCTTNVVAVYITDSLHSYYYKVFQ